jgi:hypothetical protein
MNRVRLPDKRLRQTAMRCYAAAVIGLGLLVVSAPPLILMARELIVGASVERRYSVDRLLVASQGMVHGSVRATIGGHAVALTDDQEKRPEKPHDFSDPRDEGRISILVDGRMVTAPVRSKIRLNRRDAERYRDVNLIRLNDREGPDRLVVAQNLGHGQYRTTSVFGDGTVVDDQFAYGEWCSPPVRAMLIRGVASVPIGYCSGVMQVWPSVFYPILYPWFSGALGCGITAFAAWAWLRRPAQANDVSMESDA